MGYAYSYMKTVIKDDGKKVVSFCKEDEADFILLPVNEYHGMKKAVRIVNDRFLQQVDKSKTDKYGYRILRAEKKYVKQVNGFLWLVTKETPVSIKMPMDEALTVIRDFLRETYYWFEEIDFHKWLQEGEELYEYGMPLRKPYSMSYIMSALCSYEEYEITGVIPNDLGETLERVIKSTMATPYIYDIAKIASNYAQGVYEISYWATRPV